MKYYGEQGARHYARKFYSSKAWTVKSKAYRQSHPLCEKCLRRGIYKKATCVHHKEHISKDNYQDMTVLLGDDNLESLCDDCHAKEHSNKIYYEFNEDGSMILEDEE